MNTEQDKVRRDWRIPDEFWARIVPLLPPRTPPPLGCHRPRVDDRRAREAIFFVLRTGCRWNARNHTRRCSSSAAHRRFHAWAAAGVFVQLWQCGLAAYDAFQGIDWEWLAMDGAMTNAPLGGKKVGEHPTDRGKLGAKRSLLTNGGVPIGLAVEGAPRHDGKRGPNPIGAYLPRFPILATPPQATFCRLSGYVQARCSSQARTVDS